MSQKGIEFNPHILPILKGTTVDFTNDDNVHHNVFTPQGSASIFDLGLYAPGVQKDFTFNNLGECIILCNVHPSMEAFILILQNTYFVLTDEAGNFEIKNVPDGTYKLKCWHKIFKEMTKEVVVEGGKTVSVVFEKLKKY